MCTSDSNSLLRKICTISHFTNNRFLPRSLAPRGFTLIELVVVVAFISVFAGLAVPSAVRQLRDRRVSETARQVATLYRQARLRAMGRGSAVLVRFDAGSFSVLEARMGDRNAACTQAPFPSCLANDWSDVERRSKVAGYQQGGGELATINVTMAAPNDAALTGLDVCFTPLGSAFVRPVADSSQPLTPLGATYTAQVASTASVRTRHVVVLPNGTARLTAGS